MELLRYIVRKDHNITESVFLLKPVYLPTKEWAGWGTGVAEIRENIKREKMKASDQQKMENSEVYDLFPFSSALMAL